MTSAFAEIGKWPRPPASGAPFERTPENVNLRHEDRLERFSGMVFEDEIVNVRDRHFSDFFQIQILESIPKKKETVHCRCPRIRFH